LKNISICLLIFACFSIALLSAQEKDQIRLSGLVMQADSLIPVPYTNVYIIHTKKGTIADQMGLFSIEVNKKDTVVFSAVGKRMTYYIVPDTLTAKSYSIIQKLPKDTIILRTIEIKSWPSLEQFNMAFTKEHGFDQEYIIASKNTNPVLNQIDYSKDIDINNYMEIHINKYSSVYENAHIPLNDVLNPARWNKLVQDWKNAKH